MKPAPAYSGDSQVLDFQGDNLLAAGSADGVFQIALNAAELAAYRERFPPISMRTSSTSVAEVVPR